MNELVWIFPILFLFHDMEEIIGFGLWLTNNRTFLEHKYPKISHAYQPYSTEGMATAVIEELVLCLIICIISRFTGFYGLWLGGLIAYAVHLVIHIGQSVVIRKYIPALITSIICLPVSIWTIGSSIKLLSYSAGNVVVYSLIGIVLIGGNLKIAHWIIHIFTKKFNTF